MAGASTGYQVVVVAESDKLFRLSQRAVERLGPKLKSLRAVNDLVRRFGNRIAADPSPLFVEAFDVVGWWPKCTLRTAGRQAAGSRRFPQRRLRRPLPPRAVASRGPATWSRAVPSWAHTIRSRGALIMPARKWGRAGHHGWVSSNALFL
jgi:hypothetical protein